MFNFRLSSVKFWVGLLRKKFENVQNVESFKKETREFEDLEIKTRVSVKSILICISKVFLILVFFSSAEIQFFQMVQMVRIF